MNSIFASDHLATFGAATISADRSAPPAATTGATNGFFRGIVFGFAAVAPVWAGMIWLGLKLFNHG